MNILLAMQRVDNAEWQEKVSTMYSQSEQLDPGVATDFETDDERENELPEDEGVDDEIGDILASQAIMETDLDDIPSDSERSGVSEKAVSSGNGEAWWEVAETESQRSAASFSELGSPRIILPTPRARAHKVWRLVVLFAIHCRCK